MNIVFALFSFKVGGGNRVIIELANKLSVDNNVTIMFPLNSLERHTFFLDEKVKIVEVGKYKIGNFNKIINIIKLCVALNRCDKSVYKIITDPLFAFFMPLLKKQNVYRFLQADDFRIFDDGLLLGRGIIWKMYKYLCLKSYKLKKIKWIFNSKYVFDHFVEDSKRKDVEYRIVHPAINHDFFKPSPIRNKIDKSKINISLVARKHPWKGLLTFLDAYKDLSDELKLSINEVYLISHDDLSSFELENMHVINPQSDIEIAQILQKSDIFISTSWWEGFGLPPLEAMACGCSVITSASGGVNEFAVDNYNCVMYEPKNVEQLYDRIELLIKDLELREKLKKNAIETSLRFTWDKSAEIFANILSEYDRNSNLC